MYVYGSHANPFILLAKQYCVLDFLLTKMQWFEQFYNLHNNTSWALQPVNKTIVLIFLLQL
jgi:hypothetical protein